MMAKRLELQPDAGNGHQPLVCQSAASGADRGTDADYARVPKTETDSQAEIFGLREFDSFSLIPVGN